jgi:hypothetical protein
MEIEAEIVEASRGRPSFSIGLALDEETVTDFLDELSDLQVEAVESVWLDPVDRPILDAVRRLIGKVGTPTERAILAPLMVRELAFRVLVGRQGHRHPQALDPH